MSECDAQRTRECIASQQERNQVSQHGEYLPLTCMVSCIAPWLYLIGLFQDLQWFDRECRKGQLLKRLTSLIIGLDYTLLRSAWMKDIPELVSSSPLESL